MLEVNRTPGPWSDEEIGLWGRRKWVFMTLDLNEDQAEDLAERLLYRDRDPGDDRRLCLACAYLIGSKCMNKHASVVKTFEPCKTVLWRCDYFWIKGKTMNEPIKKGDRCLVIGGLGRHKSPNIGLAVTVGQCQGEHSQHGRIWRCTGAGVQQLTDAGTYVTTGEADFAADWLQKLPPPPLKTTATTKETSHV